MSADPKPAHCPRLSKPISIVFNDTSSPGDDSNVTAEVRRADAERKAKAKYYHPIPTELFVEDFDGQTDTLARTGFNAKVPLYIFKVMAKYAGEVQFLLMEEVEKGVVVPVAETMGIRINEGGHGTSIPSLFLSFLCSFLPSFLGWCF